MPIVSKILSCYRTLFRRSQLDRDLDDEVNTYVEGLVAKRVRSGMDPEHARRTALREVGNIDSIKNDVRERRVGRGIATTAQDVRYAWRGLRKSPTFAAVTLLTLALGIGANVAVFSVVHAILLQPLPFRDSNRLVFVWSDMTSAGYPRAPLSGPELNDLRTRTNLFSGFGAIWSNTAALSGEGDPEQLRIGFVTTDFFSVLGAEPALGRTFTAEDGAPTAPATILLGWAVWQRRFGGEASIVGRRIFVNNQPTTVVGVLPRDFRLYMPPDASVPDDLQAWMPFGRGLVYGPRGQQFLRVVGRMRPGITIEAARPDVTSVARQISHQFADYGAAGRVFTLVGLKADDVREIRAPLLAVFGGVAILLLIACVNVAALIIARTAAQRQEVAIRLALGAGRGRLIRQYFVEGLLLTALGGLGSVAVAKAGLLIMLALRPHSLDRIAVARIDTSVLLFAAITALGWAVICALSPLVEMWRTDLSTALARDGRTTHPGGHGRMRSALVVMQVAFSLVLLVGALLMVRTFANIQRIDRGFQGEDAVTFRLALPGSRYPSPDARNAFARRLEAVLSGLPGVTHVGAFSHLPYDDLPNWGGAFLLARGQDESKAPVVDYRAVSPGLFDAIGAHLVEGRAFTEADDRTHDLVVIVDDRLAADAWPGQSAIGRTILVDPGSSGHANMPATVVGVVRRMRVRSLIVPPAEQIYFSERQIIRNPAAYVVTAKNASALAGPIRDAVSHLDAQLPIYDVRPLADYVAAAQAAQRFTMLLAATFAGTAVLLAAMGVYGVLSYSVTRRRREFGVRLALGARPRQILRLVVREGAALAAVGIVAGVGLSLWTANLLRAQLFGVAPDDVVSFAAAVGLLGALALLASWIPARRALATDPLETLRGE